MFTGLIEDTGKVINASFSDGALYLEIESAKLAQECGIDMILVGDSLGMAVLGYQNTLPVTLEQSLHHCAAVRRGAPDAFVIGDMPFMTCHASETDALKNAARYLQEAQCDAVKIEGDRFMAPTVARLTAAGDESIRYWSSHPRGLPETPKKALRQFEN